jgi:hypothetical protein
MATQQEINAAFSRLRAEWNRAERAIKIAEQVEGQIVNPAIYELRYAGRRIVEAFDLLESDPTSALQRLQDAQFDCCRARHDAIDAATSKMAATLDNAQEKLGIDVVMTHFAEFPAMIQGLGEVRASSDLIESGFPNQRKNDSSCLPGLEAGRHVESSVGGSSGACGGGGSGRRDASPGG